MNLEVFSASYVHEVLGPQADFYYASYQALSQDAARTTRLCSERACQPFGMDSTLTPHEATGSLAIVCYLAPPNNCSP